MSATAELAQYVDGDIVLVTVRGRVFRDASIGGVWVRAADTNIDIARHAVKVVHVRPTVEPDKYYVDAGGALYVGSDNGVLYGPVRLGEGLMEGLRRWSPAGVATLRGLRLAEVRPAASS